MSRSHRTPRNRSRRRRALWLALATALLTAGAASAAPTGLAKGGDPDRWVPGQILVKYRDLSRAEMHAELDRGGMTTLREVRSRTGETAFLQVTAMPGKSVRETVEALRADPHVVFAEPNGLYEAFAPNDPYCIDDPTNDWPAWSDRPVGLLPGERRHRVGPSTGRGRARARAGGGARLGDRLRHARRAELVLRRRQLPVDERPGALRHSGGRRRRQRLRRRLDGPRPDHDAAGRRGRARIRRRPRRLRGGPGRIGRQRSR